MQFDADLATHRRLATVGTGDDPAIGVVLGRVDRVPHRRAATHRDLDMLDATNHPGPGFLGRFFKRPARGGMTDGQGSGHTGYEAIEGRRSRLRILGRERLVVADEAKDRVAARRDQGVMDTEPLCFCDSPRMHVLAPHVVDVFGGALQHQNRLAGPGKCRRERASGNASADNDDVDPVRAHGELLSTRGRARCRWSLARHGRPGPPPLTTRRELYRSVARSHR